MSAELLTFFSCASAAVFLGLPRAIIDAVLEKAYASHKGIIKILDEAASDSGRRRASLRGKVGKTRQRPERETTKGKRKVEGGLTCSSSPYSGHDTGRHHLSCLRRYLSTCNRAPWLRRAVRLSKNIRAFLDRQINLLECRTMEAEDFFIFVVHRLTSG